MLPRKLGSRSLFIVLLAGSAGLSCYAEQSLTPAAVRYHRGDDLRWADANFDDSAWPVAENGRWPMPLFYSDGFMWVRMSIPVRGDASGPLAARTSRDLFWGDVLSFLADEVYVNGMLAGRQGSLPPNVGLNLHERDSVFELPAGAAEPGATATVAFRVWCPPVLRVRGSLGTLHTSIDERRNLLLARRAERATSLIANGPDLALNVLILILGAALLFGWRWAGGRDLLICSCYLIASSLLLLVSNPAFLGFAPVSRRAYLLITYGMNALTMVFGVELNWTVHGLRAPVLKRLFQASVVIFNGASLIAGMSNSPTALTHWSMLAILPAVASVNIILVSVNLWALLVRRANRLFAIAIISTSATVVLGLFGVIVAGRTIGPFYVSYFGLSIFLGEFVIFVMLAQRGWRVWRARDELSVEFEAAREVQEQLVVPAVDVPGFKIESAYAPAKQVGGDFFRILPGEDGGVLVVFGDVSGKGLKAAMTVSAIMGALHGSPSQRPSEVLAYLNRVLYGQVSGFVTCCAALIAKDGAMTLANAGNPAPYRNGEEMAVEPGLPLGLLAETSYEETRYQVAPGDRLTFVSDGVIEATNAKGELYGFERTRAISAESAYQIAKAAEQFGQEDDITVLTVTRENVGASAGTQISVPALSV
ncbi:MAG: phosphoserine phosphatase RsbU/P [Acidobacteriaceae bacterium]